MTSKKTTELEKLREKRRQLSARIAAQEAKQREQVKKERAALLYLFGEVVEASIKGGVLDAAAFRRACEKHLKDGRKLSLALDGITALAPSPATTEGGSAPGWG